MSSNTNTLFWVITGAVIVLAVFLLINSGQNNNLNKINNKFDSLWTGEEYEQIISEDDKYYNDNSNRNYCNKGNKAELNGVKVRIKNFKVEDSGETNFTWVINNNSGQAYYNVYIKIEIYECGTNNLMQSVWWPEDILDIDEEINLWTNSHFDPSDWNYYIKLAIDDRGDY